MAWIKRNLYFVITVAVALGVTGYCGYLLYSALGENVAASEKYAASRSGLDELLKKPVSPSPENIHAAEQDAGRVRTFLAEFRKPFAPFPTPPKLDIREFNTYLQKTIAQFGAEATNAGVGMRPDYAFSFSQQLPKINHPAEAIAPWMQELEEIKAILHILYTAKVNYLEKIKRVAVCADDSGSDDYIQFNNTTNQWGVVSPYVVNFRGFSAEIANVLAGVAASSNCFIVKTIYVSPSREPLPVIAEPPPPPPPQVQMRQFQFPPPESQPNPFSPGGPGGRFRERRQGPPPPEYSQAYQQAQAPAAAAGPVNVISETPLFVTLHIDVVKLKAPEPPAPATPAPGTTPRPPRTRRAGG